MVCADFSTGCYKWFSSDEGSSEWQYEGLRIGDSIQAVEKKKKNLEILLNYIRKRNELRIHTTTWMNQDIKLNGTS